ncbi:MAG: uroporphyrinogen-III synthase [Hyphomicrobiaceae bacterium]|nr:uroporphyrinogen-III synthase [Hyphomicrobiaceae bacterium]
MTRPEPDASEMRDRLAGMGHTADVAPLLQISLTPPPAAAFEGVTGLVVTSRNGLRALATSQALPGLLALPLYVVGRATGAAARELGFADVTVGPATAKDLVSIIVGAKGTVTVGDGPRRLLHLSGDKISFDLVPPLAEEGVQLDRITVYRSQTADAMADAVIAALREGRYDAVVLMSPLTAETFVHLVLREGLAEAAAVPAYLCLSRGIADVIRRLSPAKVMVAARPVAEDVLALVHDLASQLE